MRHVGDQLGAEALAFQPVIHGVADGLAQIVELPGMVPEGAGHLVRLQMDVGLAGENGVGGRTDGRPAPDQTPQIPEHPALIERDQYHRGGSDGRPQ